MTTVVALSGITVSPTFITAFGLVERRVSPAASTEGITWVGTRIGMALGAFASGAVIDAFGARSGFTVSLGSAILALPAVIPGQRTLVDPT